MKLRNLESSLSLTSICTLARSNFLKIMTFEWFEQKNCMCDTLFSWLFSLNLLPKFSSNSGLFTAQLQSSLAIYCAETLCDLPDANSNAQRKFAFGGNGSSGTHSSKFEMGIKRLKHMVCFSILLWNPGDRSSFPIKEY